MKTYAVGGWVRDRLLGVEAGRGPHPDKEVKGAKGAKGADKDWVVVGADPQEMLRAGFKPVGKDFPVFLHPTTHEEYALARTERKTGPGYHGFRFYAAPDVTLEQDLARRDLTINAIAMDEHGAIVDPYGGARDLAARVLRHVSPAFAEDPVRILRVARFAARWPDFTVAGETTALMRQMVDAGEADALVPERVWQEFARGLMEAKPARMFEVLRSCGALAKLLPELDRLWGVPQPPDSHPEIDTGVHMLLVIDVAAAMQCTLPARWAALLHDLGKGTTPPAQWPRHKGHEERSVELARAACERLRVPADCRDAALLAAREHGHMHKALALDAAGLVRLLERCDALRRPALLKDALDAAEADFRGRAGFETRAFPQRARIEAALAAAAAVDAGAAAARVAADAPNRGERIAQVVHQARVDAVRATIDTSALS